MTILAAAPLLRITTTALGLVLAAAALILAPGRALALGPNLVPNGGVEAGPEGFTPYAGPAVPATLAWQEGGAGSPGSLSVTFNEGSAGGPAWYAPEVPVAGGTDYIVQTSSRGAASELLVRFTLADGSMRWRTLAQVGPSGTWQRTRARMRAPEQAKTASVYQEVIRPGTLETDDYSLTLASSPDLSSGIPNGDLEQDADLDPDAPLGWSGHRNQAAEYSTTRGRRGGRAVRVSLSRYSPRALAYWETETIPVTPGAVYQFSDWYRSNAESRVYVEIQRADGSWRSVALKTVGPSPLKFRRYQTRFLMPSYARRASLIHVPLERGTLITDDYALARVGASSFDRATVSLTFDDGYATDAGVAAPALAASRVRASFYPVSGLIDQPGYMTREDLRSLVAAGHEVGSHSVSHPDLTAIGSLQRLHELAGSRLQLQGILGPRPIEGIASPYGAYNSSVLAAMVGTGYRYHRSLDEGLNEPEDWDPMRIRSFLMLSETTPEDLQLLLERAAADRTWLVLVYHGIDDSGDLYSVSPAQLESQLAQITASGARVLPVREAIEVLSPQVPKTRAAIRARKKARKAARAKRRGTPIHRLSAGAPVRLR